MLPQRCDASLTVVPLKIHYELVPGCRWKSFHVKRNEEFELSPWWAEKFSGYVLFYWNYSHPPPFELMKILTTHWRVNNQLTTIEYTRRELKGKRLRELSKETGVWSSIWSSHGVELTLIVGVLGGTCVLFPCVSWDQHLTNWCRKNLTFPVILPRSF
jgi:hypothetical protein